MDIETPINARYYGDQASNPTGGIIPLSGVANTSDMILYQYVGGVWKALYSLLALKYYLLIETGDILLLETGDKLVLE